MITIAFPPLQKALMKAEKEWKDNDIRRGVIVLDSNAIVVADQYCIIVNLEDYFTVEFGITEEIELKELEKIMFFMNWKMFSKEFWTELTGGNNIKIENGMIKIENPKYQKDLHYKEMDMNLYGFASKLISIKEKFEDKGAYSSDISLPFVAMNKIYSILPSEFKLDNIIFSICHASFPVLFTFRNRKHFYGYLVPHYDSSVEGYKFAHLEHFVQGEDIKIALESFVPPPPPPPSPETNVKNDDEFEGEQYE